MLTRRRLWLVVMAAASAPALGCGSASVYGFSARPRQICPQTKAITVTWMVDGNVSLSVQPPLPGADLDDAPAVGNRSIVWSGRGAPAGATDVTVTLTASRRFGKTQRHQQVVHAVTPGQPSTLAPDRAEITCDPTHRSVIGVAQFEPDEYDEAVVIRSLRNAADRPITVTHRGGVWTVPPGQEVPLAEQRPHGRSTGAAGTWILSAPLLDGEVCFTPSARAALNLALDTTLDCRAPEGGSP